MKQSKLDPMYEKRSEDERVLLWPDGAPGALGENEEDQPTLAIYHARNTDPDGPAVIVFPGGGYGFLAVDHEGEQVAQWLVARGISAYVLRYRIAPKYKHPAPLQDAQRALRMVRFRRSQRSRWDFAPSRIGVWGFSAGGHLASTLATHFDSGDATATESIERASCRPNFQILCYPVITLKPPHAHGGSRDNLLGQNPNAALLESLCNETQVTPQTPHAFLFHTADDGAVPVENSLLYFQSLKNCGVPAELHVYRKGAHGVGLAQDDARLREWPDALASWLHQYA